MTVAGPRIEVSFRLTPDENASAVRAAWWGSRGVRILLAALVLAFALGVFGAVARGNPLTAVVGALPLLGAVGYWWLGPRLIPPPDGEQRWTFDRAGVEVTTTGQPNRVRWTLYRRARRVGGFYLLYVSPWLVHTVPASAFADDAERRAFEELVRGSVPGL